MKEFFSIGDLTTMTGLRDRTIRNYIHNGILHSDKSNGAWRFSAEDTDAFMQKPAVLRAIHAHHNAIVYDFLQDHYKSGAQLCCILDLDDDAALGYFLSRVPKDAPEIPLRLCYDEFRQHYRIILRGSAVLITDMLQGYISR